jgi:hypothetical protein
VYNSIRALPEPVSCSSSSKEGEHLLPDLLVQTYLLTSTNVRILTTAWQVGGKFGTGDAPAAAHHPVEGLGESERGRAERYAGDEDYLEEGMKEWDGGVGEQGGVGGEGGRVEAALRSLEYITARLFDASAAVAAGMRLPS